MAKPLQTRCFRPAPAVLFLLLGALSATQCGCSGGNWFGPDPELPVGAMDNPLVVESEYEPLFDAVARTLEDHRFTLFLKDPREGEIRTRPMTGQQMWEYWRTDAAGFYNTLESSMHTILRTVEARVYPLRDSQGSRIAGKYFLEMHVITERVTVPEQEISATNQLSGASFHGGSPTDPALAREGIRGVDAVYLGRDSRLEDWLIRDVLRKVRQPAPVVPRDEPAPPPPPATAS
ncbi:MAG: hypothetical protein BIFFINMI_00568 [Phycisphaerae bacterium]|nr:hypothetical protein [Phycisphaerae bacterium]